MWLSLIGHASSHVARLAVTASDCARICYRPKVLAALAEAAAPFLGVKSGREAANSVTSVAKSANVGFQSLSQLLIKSVSQVSCCCCATRWGSLPQSWQLQSH